MAESQDPEDPIFGETRVDEPCGLVGQSAGCAQAVGKAGHGQDLHRVSFHPFTIVHPSPLLLSVPRLEGESLVFIRVEATPLTEPGGG